MQKAYNTYYNINNEYETFQVKDKVISTNVPNKSKEKIDNALSAFRNNTIAHSAVYSVGAGLLAGLLISIVTHKNFIMNMLIGGALGYAGNEYLIKDKKVTKTNTQTKS